MISESQMPKLRYIPSALAALLLITLASCSLNGAAAQSTTGEIDQQCSAIGNSYLDGVGVHQPAGQTFIPAQSSMTGLAFFLWSSNTAPTSMTANIISNGILGVNSGQGTLAGTVTFTVPANYGQPTGAWLDVALPSGVVLIPGDVYAINMVDNSSSGGINWGACSGAYGNGCGYANGQCQAFSWAFIDYYGDFSVALSTTAISIAQGASGTVNLYVASRNNFASPVSLSFSTPPGVTASFNGPNQIQMSAGGTSSPTVTIYVAGTVATGTYPFTVTASSGSITHSASLRLTVSPTGTIIVASTNLDFLPQPSPTVMTLSPGVSASTTVTISSVNGFSSPVSLSTAWSGAAPQGITVSFPSRVTLPAGGTASSTLTLNADTSPSTGTYTLGIKATNGPVSHTTDITVTIAGTPSVLANVNGMNAQGFSMSPTTDSVSTNPGLSAGTSVVVNSLHGFSSPVTFSVTWVGSAPTGVAINLPQTVTPPAGGEASSPIEFTTTSIASTGNYTLQVTGTSDGASHSTQITLRLSSP